MEEYIGMNEMNNNETPVMTEAGPVVKSVRNNGSKPIIIAWAVLAALAIALLVFAGVKWRKYVEAQELAISATELFKSNDKETRREKAQYYYEYLTDYYYSSFYDTSEINEALRNADKSLGEVLNSAGYDCYYGSDYLRYTDYFQYLWGGRYLQLGHWPVIILAGLMLILGVITVLRKLDKRELIIEDKITAKTFGGKTVTVTAEYGH